LENSAELISNTAGAHPALNFARQRVNVADAAVSERKSQFLPKLSGGYSKQKVGGESGFYSFEVGIQIPLIFGPELGRVQSARIEREIAEQKLMQTQLEFNSSLSSTRENFLKWLNSWNYYSDKALPLAREQRQGAITAYNEGAINYVAFLQNIRDAVQIEVDSWNAFGSYLDSRFQLEYYLKTSN
jgi:cobalt-zinc-cadmium resistance protein CzcA